VSALTSEVNVALALAATDAADENEADMRYRQLIEHLDMTLSGDEKRIALELQNLAREVESARDKEVAFAFKQQTCAHLLEWSMGHKQHTARSEVNRQTEAKPPRHWLGKFEFLLLPSKNIENDLNHYTKILNASLLWRQALPDGELVCLRLSTNTLIVLCENCKQNCALPVWSVEDFKVALQSLNDAGCQVKRKIEGAELSCLVVADSSGNGLGLLSANKLLRWDVAPDKPDRLVGVQGMLL